MVRDWSAESSSNSPASNESMLIFWQSKHTDNGIGTLFFGGGPNPGSLQYTDSGMAMVIPYAKVPDGHESESVTGKENS